MSKGERWAAEAWYDPAFARTKITAYYQREPHGDIYQVNYYVPDELLTSPHHADYALAYAIRKIIDEFRTRFYIGPWKEMELAIAKAVETPSTYAPRREDTHYKDHASSEFEGVEDLDPSLWNTSEEDLL